MAAAEQQIHWSPSLNPAVLLVAPIPTEAGSWPANAGVADALLAVSEPSPVLLAGAKIEEPLAALIPLDASLPDRVDALLRLWQGLQGGLKPPDRRITAQQRQRMRLMMQAVDGRHERASYRTIAEAMFGVERVRSDPWKTSSLRDKVIGLVEGGSSLVAGGYLRLFRQRRRLSL